MSVIMPSGKQGFEWSPKIEEPEMVRTASTTKKEVEPDHMLLAAEKFLAKKAQLVDDTNIVDEKKDVVEEVVEVAKDVTGTAAEAVEKAEEAVKEVSVALETVKEKVEDVNVEEVAKEDKPEDVEEVEIEITDDEPEEVEIEIEDDECEEDEKECHEECEEKEEECKEEKPEDKFVKEGDDKEVVAKSLGGFVRVSSLSKSTKSKISDYYINQLGYDKDWVNLWMTDFEKK